MLKRVKSIIVTIFLVFLLLNLGVVYYILLFGDVPRFAQRLDLLEKRVESLVRRDGEVTQPEVEVVGDEALVVLSDQQQQELSQATAEVVQKRMEELVAKQVEEEITSKLGGDVVKEYYIPLGRAELKTENNQWVNTGLETSIDLARYSGEKKVYFEGTLKVPTANGEVQVRLVDGVSGVIQGSELVAGGDGGTFRRSGALTVGDGERVVRVEMRTTLNYEGVAEALRLKVVVD